MLRCFILRTTGLLAGSSVIAVNNDDDKNSFWVDLLPSFLSQKTSHENITPREKGKDELTGWDRLYIMYTKDEFGHLSKELNSILYCTYSSFFVGGCIGLMKRTKVAHREFLERNQATQFPTVFDARKAMQDKVLLAAMKGVFHDGSRLALFTGGILSLTISLMVYSDNTSILHYGAAGALVGTVHRWKTGPRGMAVGGLAGGILGLLTGVTTKGFMYLIGKDLDDIMTYHDQIMTSRTNAWQNLEAQAIRGDKGEDYKLLEEHQLNIENSESVSGTNKESEVKEDIKFNKP